MPEQPLRARPGNLPAARWSRLQRRLHWLVALLVGVQFLLQVPMRNATEAAEAGSHIGFTGFAVTTIHSWSGIAIGLVVFWRLRLRAETGWRQPPRHELVRLHHALLYAALLVMVGSGFLQYFAGVSGARSWHVAGKWIVVALVAVHVCGALWHWLVRRDRVLQSMLGGDPGD